MWSCYYYKNIIIVKKDEIKMGWLINLGAIGLVGAAGSLVYRLARKVGQLADRLKNINFGFKNLFAFNAEFYPLDTSNALLA